MMRWARRFRRLHTGRWCTAWNPPGGAGRDTCVCLRARRHDGAHLCKCGSRW